MKFCNIVGLITINQYKIARKRIMLIIKVILDRFLSFWLVAEIKANKEKIVLINIAGTHKKKELNKIIDGSIKLAPTVKIIVIIKTYFAIRNLFKLMPFWLLIILA